MVCLFCQIVNKEKKAYIIAENAGAIFGDGMEVPFAGNAGALRR